jgi:hypothetical protein
MDCGMMKLPPFLFAVVLVIAGASVAAAQSPYERADWATPESEIDRLVVATLADHGIEPANPCSDEVFVRRVYLDTIGRIPTPDEAREFLDDARPNKRAALIDALLARSEFADYWSLKWCDLLRVKAEFPINLWPNAVQLYHRWIRDGIRDGMPYDEFTRALLTSSGSNFRVGPVNFYRGVQSREPAGLAEAVALMFMGTRIGTWPEDQREGMAAFFSRLQYKPTDEWKEEIVQVDPTATGPLQATFPDGTSVTIPAGEDPRVVFADWLITPENPWFTRSIANRVWSWLMGRGIIHEPDDIRPDNPPVNPELLSYLERELVSADYDLRHLFRLIMNSRTWQQSPVAQSDSPEAEALFACYPVRRLEAEVLIDTLDWLGGTGQMYTSPIPEPFTWIPADQPSILLADGSITSTFLQMFGRPPRDTGLESERGYEINDAQRLYLLNSTDVYRRVANSLRLRRIAIAAGGDRDALISGIYMILLSREPTAAEVADAAEYWATPGVGEANAATDLAWSLINSMEFLYRH